MISLFRKKSVRRNVTWGIAILIIISFGILGTGYLLTDIMATSYAGEIYGKKIKQIDFSKTYRDVRIQEMIRYGDRFNQIQQFLNLDQKTWDRLILLKKINKSDINIPDSTVEETIKSYPFFQREGQFDSLIYNDILRFVFQIEPRDFEESVRETLKISAYFENNTNEVSVSDEEIRTEYERLFEEIEVSYLLLNNQNYVDQVTIDETELVNFFTENKEQFRVGPQVATQYLQITKPTGSDDPAGLDTLRIELEALSPRLTMEELAEKVYAPIQRTGFIPLNRPNPELEWSFEIIAKLEGLDIGEITPVQETNQFFYFIAITERKEQHTPPLEEIREEVMTAYKLAKASEISEEYALSAYQQLKEQSIQDGAALNVFAQGKNILVKELPKFRRGQYLPEIGLNVAFQDLAFGLNEQQRISEPINLTNGSAIIYLINRFGIDEEKFAAEEDNIRNKLVQEKQNELINEFIESARQEANLQIFEEQQTSS